MERIRLVDRLAAFAAGIDSGTVPAARFDAVRLHAFDSLAALRAGSAVEEAALVRELVADAATLPTNVLIGCAAARSSEVDDIHLASGVTPGALVVPAALAAAATLPNPEDDAFVAACLAGYEVMIRFGLAIDGPRLLYRGIWPTYACSGFGVAAAVGVLLGLDAEQLAEALAIVATRATGTTGRILHRTSRWLTLGLAAHDAVVAVRAAQLGLRGDRSLLDGPWSEVTAIALDPDVLLDGLGERFCFDEMALKPVCAAKQTIAALHAFRVVLERGVAAEAIGDVLVEVPPVYRAMIDRPHLPTARLESLTSVQYQLALAAYAPARLYDVVRATFAVEASVRDFVRRVRVVPDPELESYYPEAWPARITVRTDDGARHAVEAIHPLGDVGTGFGWDAAIAKHAAILPSEAVADLASACRRLGTGSLPEIIALR